MIEQLKLANATTYDRLFAYYVNGGESVELTDKEQELRQRYERTFALLCDYHSSEMAVPVLMKTQDISRATAYRDIVESMKLFGNVNKIDREGKRYVLYEYSMKIFQLASQGKPPDLENMNRAITNMMKISGLDKEDPDLPKWELLRPSNFMLQVNINGKETHTIDLNELDKQPEAMTDALIKNLEAPKLTTKQMIKIIQDSNE